MEALLIGGGEGTQRGEEFRHQQQHEQRRARTRKTSGDGLGAVAQCDDDQRHRHRQVECHRGQKRQPQDAHGTAAQLVGGAAESAGLVAGAAMHDDGGNAAHAVEEAGLQMRKCRELASRGDGGADA